MRLASQYRLVSFNHDLGQRIIIYDFAYILMLALHLTLAPSIVKWLSLSVEMRPSKAPEHTYTLTF